MAAAADEHKRRLGVAFYRRGYPQGQAIRKLLAAGAIGQPLFFQFHFGMWYRPEEGAPGSWRLDPAMSGGGALPDVGSHRIDLARFWAGPFASATGKVRTTVPGWKVDDIASVLIESKSSRLRERTLERFEPGQMVRATREVYQELLES